MAQKAYDKIVDEIAQMTVMQVAELVKALEERFGVSAAMPASAAPVAGAAPVAEKAEEKSSYKVTLKEGGPEKIKSIKALRSVTTLGLTEAKKAVEEAPTVIAESASKADAMKIKEALEAAGAKVELS